MTVGTEPWTEERVKRLRELWRDGRSATEIANELGGVSRNAVIGKIHRLEGKGRRRNGVRLPIVEAKKPTLPSTR